MLDRPSAIAFLVEQSSTADGERWENNGEKLAQALESLGVSESEIEAAYLAI